ncbi:Dps family protein [Actinomyces ruminicola]|uniref:Starvation-inducible DNA-binding protein n=1 Tax=Actinomyces ruminicola TaxID=332524 RepID=A0A1H0AU92_9ACTO|nr:DNA starvation/stationary phase protection protein [Actinomyces ruminicola]SDM30759.1 starvation-inducible DNA-binding protein [Actinomyces ruminicola]SDN36905.1 starvation-inducible DNA-binding protein [Actinomyces ruminicola]
MSNHHVKNPAVIPTFTASETLATDLQRALVDITALSLVGKQVHWNLVGPNFRDLHLNLDEVVDIAREGSDELAERMRAINVFPDGRPGTIASQTSVPEAPEAAVITADAVDYIVSAINAVVTTLRDIHDAVDEADPSSSGILEDYTQRLEQQSWFLSAQNYSAS